MILIKSQLGITILSLKERRVEVKEHIASMLLEVTSVCLVEVAYKGFASLC